MISSGHETISTRDFNRLRRLIYDEAGINLGDEKKLMLEGRIKRRLKALNLDSYGRYCEYLFGQGAQHGEIVHLIDVVTTNKTDFFREPRHFELLNSKVLPDLLQQRSAPLPLQFWSAACSSGEEPYTLAMVLSEYAQTYPPMSFRILATDISTAVLSKARKGIYTNEIVAPVPPALRRKYLMRSRDHGSDLVRVVPELRGLVEFQRLNFMQDDYEVPKRMHAIFCRNVLIYFDRPTQESILRKLIRHLVPNGYLFVGHAETLHDMDLPLTAIAPALYRRSHAT